MGHTEACELLVMHGHAPDVVDAAGHQPAYYARVKGHGDAVAVLALAVVAAHEQRQEQTHEGTGVAVQGQGVESYSVF